MDNFIKITLNIAQFLYCNRDIIKTWFLMLIPFFLIVAIYVPSQFAKLAYSFDGLLFISFICFNLYINGINNGFEKNAIVEANEAKLEFYKEQADYFSGRIDGIIENK